MVTIPPRLLPPRPGGSGTMALPFDSAPGRSVVLEMKPSLPLTGGPWTTLAMTNSVTVRGEFFDSSSEPFQRIFIRDNGPGIPADVLPKLFLPFFTTKANGTGLGLAIVQKILLQHGGQIEARNRAEARCAPASPPGIKVVTPRDAGYVASQGAEFIVTLPAVRQLPEAVESREVAI